MTQHKDLTGTDLHVNKLHATTHQDGGTDEISLTGLVGALGNGTTATTQTPADNSTKVATTAYADAIAALKANLASPTFTGTPAAPTASPGTNTTQLATTAFTKAAVDAAINGLSWKQEVRAASTANVTLASAVENGDTLDGVTLATGDRILLKNQSTGAENGIYIVAASGAPSRAADADAGAELVNATVFVSEGTANADTGWTCTNNATPTLGSTALTFVQFGNGTTYTADESTLHLSSTTFSIKAAGVTGTEIASSVALAGNPTTTTQSASNNSTRIATTAYVDAAVTAGGGGSVIYLGTLTASSSATLEFTGITSGYDQYQFHFVGLVPGTTATALWMRMGTGGGPTYDTGANYSVDQWLWRSGGSGVGGATGQTKIAMMGSSQATTANWSISGQATLFNPNSATLYKHAIGEFRIYDGTFRATNQFSGTYESTTAVTGIQFLMSSGNIASGKIIVYGFKNS